MLRRSAAPLLAAAALIIGLGTGTASAMQLVAGGYGEEVERHSRPAPSLSMRQLDFNSSAASAGLTFDFTPRNSGSLFSPGSAEPETMSLSLGLQQGYGDRLRLGTIGLGGAASATPTETLDGLAIGGAFSMSDWQLTGSMGRASLLGREADVFAAGLGYGPVNARLVYGTVPETATDAAGDVLMFSTDLAAWSWLTLQGDVAVSDTLASEPLTVGRIGLRLNF